METYKNYLLETIDYLDNIEGELFTLNVNLMMSGEMSELNYLFDENENVVFKMKDFEHTPDENIKIITALLIRIGRDLATLKNINNINEDDNLLF